MRYVLIVLWMLFASVTSAMAQVSVGVGIGLPGLSIGINLPVYPHLVPVPGYPVYYAPGMNSNYFFYDGMYWVYQGDNWYASSWYNGPWGLVGPEAVPLFVLRVPVSYYRSPPVYFVGWRADAPPRWGEHWGHDWEQRRSGWDRWNRSSAPRPAPLPVYQRQYSGDRYPQAAQQQALHSQNYHYQPRDAAVRQQYQRQAVVQKAPAPAQQGQQGAPKQGTAGQQAIQRSNAPASVQQIAPTSPRAQPPQKAGENVQRPAPTQAPPERAGENVQRSAPTQAPPQKAGQNVQRPASAQAPMQVPAQKGGESMQRSAPTHAPAQERGPAAQTQKQQPQPQQGAAQHATQEQGRGQGQAKEHEKSQQ